MPDTLADWFQSFLSPKTGYNAFPASQNIEDRRGQGPLELHITPQPLNFGAQPYAVPMEGRVPSPLSNAAGFNDIANSDFDEMTDARSSAFSQLDRRTPMDAFRGTLGLNGAMEDLQRGTSPLIRGRR